MLSHRVGSTSVTDLGLGAAQLGNLYHEVSETDALLTVESAWDTGIRYFDTAPHYGLGLSEWRLGHALAQFPREEYVVSTKVGRRLVPSPESAHRMDESFAVRATHTRVWDFSRDGIRRSLDDSLIRLGLDRVDIAYLHDPDEHWAEASTSGVDALVELRDAGIVGAIGVGMNSSGMLAEFVRRCDVDVVMVAGRYTLLDQSAATDLLPLALDRGVAVVAAGVYNSGLLSTDRAAAGAMFDYGRASNDLVERANEIADICAGYGVSLPEAAIGFAFQHPAVVSVVLGARNAEQARVNAARHEKSVPVQLWDELRDAGIILGPEANTPTVSNLSTKGK